MCLNWFSSRHPRWNINTFLPFGMFSQVFPEIAENPVFSIVGVIFSAVAFANVIIALKKPKKVELGKKAI